MLLHSANNLRVVFFWAGIGVSFHSCSSGLLMLVGADNQVAVQVLRSTSVVVDKSTKCSKTISGVGQKMDVDGRPLRD